ncbi:hypothetical protein SMU108_09588, partial [Streptococcus mutans M230]
MSFTDEKYRYIADQSYLVEEGRDDVDYHPQEHKNYYYNKDKKSLGQFKVLKVVDNTSNGMQAMAVAPLDKNGKPDLSHIVVAYAGTNRSDLKDIQTDIQSIGLGEKRILADSSTKTFRTSQFQTALTFAKEI